MATLPPPSPTPRTLLRRRLVALGVLVAVPLAALGLTRGGGPPEAVAAKLPPGRPVTVAWAGDTTLGSSFGLPAGQGTGLLRGVAPLLRAADLTAVNLEGTLSTGGSSKCGAGGSGGDCFAFRAPPRNARALRQAGVDVVNLANNHAFDFGAIGLGQTVSALRAARVAETGRPFEVRVLPVNGAKVAFVGFSTYPWSSPMGDPAAVRTIIGGAAKQANLVVVVFHAGAEGSDRTHVPRGGETAFGEDRGDSRAFARQAIDAGADLVVGSGPHVLRGMELYRGRLVAYSLGNLVGYKNFATGGTLSLSAILRATLDADGRLLAGRLESLALSGDGIPGVDRSGAAGALITRLSKEGFGAAAVGVGLDGRLIVPGRATAAAPG